MQFNVINSRACVSAQFSEKVRERRARKKRKKKVCATTKDVLGVNIRTRTTRADADFSRVQGGRQNEIHRANTYTLYIDRLIIQ